MIVRAARWLAVAALVVGYPLLAYYTSDPGRNEAGGHMGALVAIAPLVLVALYLAWRSPRRPLMLALLAGCGVVLYAIWPALAQHFGVLYWLQHAGMQVMLGVLFGRTLMAGQLPLCTRFARAVHAVSPLSPAHERYARQVTAAWTLFFAAMAVISTLLFFLTPLSIWSIFANFVTPLLVTLMFVVEHGVRYRIVPKMPRASMLDAIRAFQQSAEPPDGMPRS